MVLKVMSNQFSGDQVFDCGESATSELSKPPPPPPSECPRCGSTNTKFCYYNNYNKSQPRHLCKSCKRHWTKGGTLRSIPAGRRHRNKRPRTSTAAAAATPAAPRQERFSTDQSGMSDILYQALVRSSSSVPHSTILESYGTTYAAPVPQSQNSELITFVNSTSINSTSNYQFSGCHFSGENLDTTEESIVMTGAAPPWTAANPSAAAELWSSNNEIGFLGSSWSDPYAVWDEFDAYKPIFEGY